MAYIKRRVEDLTTTDWNSLIGDDYVLFVGSAISIWGEQGMPNGQLITSTIISRLMKEIPFEGDEQMRIIEQWLQNVPFEVILGKCNHQEALRDWIYEMCNRASPNGMHKAVVQYALKSRTKVIITTNYDTCLEEYMERAQIKYRVIIKEADLSATFDDCVIVYKIHGSAEKDHISSLIFSDEQEARLPEEKKRILDRMLRGRNLLMLGYSGLDFEICPEILATDPKNIVWNFLKNEGLQRSIGFNYYIGRTNRKNGFTTMALLGEMKDMVSRFWGMGDLKLECKELIVPAINVSRPIQQLWVSRVLQAMGIGELALKIIDSVKYEEIKDYVSSYQFYKYYARAHFYVGNFIASYAFHKKCEMDVPASKKDVINNKIAIANICQDLALAGAVVAGYEEYDPIEWINSSEEYLNEAIALQNISTTILMGEERQLVRARYLLAKVRLLKYRDWLAYYADEKGDNSGKYFISDKQYTEFQAEAKKALEEAVKLFEEVGDYTDRANCYLFAAQFQVHLHVSDTSLDMSQAGYNHLGCKLGEMLFFRTKLRQSYLEKSLHELDSKESAALDVYIRETGILGMRIQHQLFKEVRTKLHALGQNLA